MPIYDIFCRSCRYRGEVLATAATETAVCPECGGTDTTKDMSPTSSLTGRTAMRVPGPGDTACCGQHPQQAGCSGPGSCCGKR